MPTVTNICRQYRPLNLLSKVRRFLVSSGISLRRSTALMRAISSFISKGFTR